MKKNLFISFIFLFNFVFSQIDSLYKKLRENPHDTVKVKIHYKIGMNFEELDPPDSAIFHFKYSAALSEKIDFIRLRVSSLGELGYFLLQLNEVDSALSYLHIAYSINNDPQNPKFIELVNSLGTAYYYKGDYIKAYEYFLKYLNYVEKSGTPYQLSRANSNVGVILKEQKKYDDALVFFNKSLKVAIENKSSKNQYVAFINIGNVYAEKSNHGKSMYNSNLALEYYLKAKSIILEKDALENYQNAIILLGNIGNIYADLKKFDMAVAEYKLALSFLDKIENFPSAPLIYNNLASVYVDMGKLPDAKKYLELGYEASNRSGSPNDFLNNYVAAARYYELSNDYRSAYQYQVRVKQLSDSIFSTDAAEKRKELELNIEYEKKEAETKALQEKKELLAEQEKKKQQIILYAFIGGFILMLIVAFQIFRGYRQKQRSNEIIMQQKDEVEKQKELVEEKQKEILDSILYARRIQRSLLPTDKYMERILKKKNNKT